MTKEDWVRKLTSRKFWVALIGFVTGLLIYLGKSEAEAAQIGALIMSAGSLIAFIIGEGLVDAASAGADQFLVEDEAHPPEDLPGENG